MKTISHPAKFNKKFIPIFAHLLGESKLVLDPFSGVGTIAELEPYGFETIGVEIEPEWAHSVLGDSRYLPFKDTSFDAVCTSPTYGNRMADSFTDHKLEKAYVRNTYHHHLKRKLSVYNTGRYHFGNTYLSLHRHIWKEVARVLKHDGKIVLNTKNFIHNNIITDVTGAHINILKENEFDIDVQFDVPTNGLQFGANRNRVGYETITLLKYKANI
jgi:tRNA G10  N-methylase Trm11